MDLDGHPLLRFSKPAADNDDKIAYLYQEIKRYHRERAEEIRAELMASYAKPSVLFESDFLK